MDSIIIIVVLFLLFFGTYIHYISTKNKEIENEKRRTRQLFFRSKLAELKNANNQFRLLLEDASG